MPSDLILASESPRRALLLRALGVRFEQIPSDVVEDHDQADPEAAAIASALKKAMSVAQSYPEAEILGADTVVVTPKGEILGKPADEDDALRMLMTLSGREHQVITGVALVGPGHEVSSAETTSVRMRTYTREEAARYARSGEPMDKAGAYGIQGLGGLLVKSLTGCYFNVVGLPLQLLYQMLRANGLAEEWLGPDTEQSDEPSSR
jgi:septum formation protein